MAVICRKSPAIISEMTQTTRPITPTIRVAVGVTIFRPDWSLLQPLVDLFQPMGLEVFAHIDGPIGMAIEPETLKALEARPWVRLLRTPENQGIGFALNKLAEAAGGAGASHLLVFDQDSSPTPPLPALLASALTVLQEAGERPAVVGPRPVVPPGEIGQPPRYVFRRQSVSHCEAVDYVITSGSLVDLSAFSAIGPFRADYFIDGIDVEWSLRAWDHGFSVWITNDAELPHRIGQGVIKFGFLRFPDQSQARMITYVRNRAAMLRLSHMPLRWKLQSLIYVPLQSIAYSCKRGGWSFLWRLVRAAADGWKGHLTPVNTGR